MNNEELPTQAEAADHVPADLCQVRSRDAVVEGAEAEEITCTQEEMSFETIVVNCRLCGYRGNSHDCTSPECREATLERIRRLEEQVKAGEQLTGSFFEALKPLKLEAIDVNNPGRHVTDLIDRLTASEQALEKMGWYITGAKIAFVAASGIGVSDRHVEEWLGQAPEDFKIIEPSRPIAAAPAGEAVSK